MCPILTDRRIYLNTYYIFKNWIKAFALFYTENFIITTHMNDTVLFGVTVKNS